MKIFFTSIFSGTFLFYITFTLFYPFMSNTVDAVEDLTFESYNEAVEPELKQLLITGQNLIGIYNEDDLYDILDDRDDVDSISIEVVNTIDKGRVKGDIINLEFTYTTDILISMNFLSESKAFFPPQFSRTPVVINSRVDVGTSEFSLNTVQSGLLLRSLFRSDKNELSTYIAQYYE